MKYPVQHAEQLVRMTMIPAGTFMMGGREDDKFASGVELPLHQVTIRRGFGLGITPVTQGQWRLVTGSGSAGSDDELPVTGVTFQECFGFLRKLGPSYRLPSEAEWEYACRAGSNSVFPEGSDLAPHQANYLYDESGVPVGTGCLVAAGRYPANGFGLHDMLGNVCEWTADPWRAGYHNAPSDGSARTDGDPARRTIRGGGWDHLPRVLRPSWRDWAPLAARWDNLGFRVACDR